jgi:uncharacterized membrane protein
MSFSLPYIESLSIKHIALEGRRGILMIYDLFKYFFSFLLNLIGITLSQLYKCIQDDPLSIYNLTDQFQTLEEFLTQVHNRQRLFQRLLNHDEIYFAQRMPPVYDQKEKKKNQNQQRLTYEIHRLMILFSCFLIDLIFIFSEMRVYIIIVIKLYKLIPIISYYMNKILPWFYMLVLNYVD